MAFTIKSSLLTTLKLLILIKSIIFGLLSTAFQHTKPYQLFFQRFKLDCMTSYIISKNEVYGHDQGDVDVAMRQNEGVKDKDFDKCLQMSFAPFPF